jgi:uncharacterized protein YbjT (DUF2867 family)
VSNSGNPASVPLALTPAATSFPPMHPSVSAFVAGATGYTGRDVVAALRRRGVETTAHVRADSRDRERWTTRFAALGAQVDHTPWTTDAMAQTFVARRPSMVFALLGTTRARAGREGIGDPYETIDFGLTEMLRAGAVAAGHAPLFVYLSAYGATEEGGNRYLVVRGRMERQLREGPLPFLIAQPLFITGSDRDEGRLGERVASVLLDGVLGAVAALGGTRWRDRFSSMTGATLAEGLVALALADLRQRLTADAAMVRAASVAAPAPPVPPAAAR